MPASAALFTATDLTGWLGRSVSDARAEAVERVVWGWLQPIFSSDSEDRPNPVPARVYSWAVELGAIAHENPSGLSERELGPGRQQFSAERRSEILRLAADGGQGTGVLVPVSSFPTALGYPDPAIPTGRRSRNW